MQLISFILDRTQWTEAQEKALLAQFGEAFQFGEGAKKKDLRCCKDNEQPQMMSHEQLRSKCRLKRKT